jgi:hypothetical protein
VEQVRQLNAEYQVREPVVEDQQVVEQVVQDNMGLFFFISV